MNGLNSNQIENKLPEKNEWEIKRERERKNICTEEFPEWWWWWKPAIRKLFGDFFFFFDVEKNAETIGEKKKPIIRTHFITLTFYLPDHLIIIIIKRRKDSPAFICVFSNIEEKKITKWKNSSFTITTRIYSIITIYDDGLILFQHLCMCVGVCVCTEKNKQTKQKKIMNISRIWKN